MRHLCRAVLIALGLAAVLGVPPAAEPAAVRAFSLPALVGKADRIVLADVVEVRTVWDREGDDRVPVTLVTLSIARTLKGPASVQLVIEMPGGEIDGERLEVLEAPRFRTGERAVLFLQDGAGRFSPIAGFSAGRFPVTSHETPPVERVARQDGRPLLQRDLAVRDVVRPGAPASLAQFEAAIVRLAADAADGRAAIQGGGSPAGDEDEEAAFAAPAPSAAVAAVPAPSALRVDLGSAPALLNGCADWECVVHEALARVGRQPASSASSAAGALAAPPDAKARHVLSVGWGRVVLGRPLGEDILAVTIRRTSAAAGATLTTVVFNDAFAWNAYEGPTRRLPTGQPIIDLGRVAAREFAAAFDVGGAEATDAPATNGENASGGASPNAARASLRRDAKTPAGAAKSAKADFDTVQASAAACDSGGAVVDPRLLVFNSPDHALMTGYQVGFFQPGASSPTQVVDLPLTALLIRRVIDLPPSAALALQLNLVADIRTAGLATPLAIVYTYGVRGVWAGGTTAWSERSQPFVRCAAAATAR